MWASQDHLPAVPKRRVEATYPLQTRPPFRAEHIGSLKRPEKLLHFRSLHAQGNIDANTLEEATKHAIRSAIDLQRRVGLKSLSNGEQGREIFFEGFHDRLEGFDKVLNPSPEIFKPYCPDVRVFFDTVGLMPSFALVATGKIKWMKPCYGPEFSQLKALVDPDQVPYLKFTIVSPEWYHLRHQEHAYSRNVYENDEEYFADIATAYRKELQDLYDRGCRNIQMDAPLLTFFCDDGMRKGLVDDGKDPDALLDSYIRFFNACLEGAPCRPSVHLCRGNFHGQSFVRGTYDRIAAKVFRDLDVDVFYVEYDNDHDDSFDLLAHLPVHKRVVLGLVSTKNPKLESVESLKDRVHEAARVLAGGKSGTAFEDALNRLSISTQCGFASVSIGNAITCDQQESKLRRVVEASKAIWSDA